MIIVEDRNAVLGLAVDKIVGTGWINIQHLVAANNIPDAMASFVCGEWLLNSSKNQDLQLLDPIAILHSNR